MSYLIFAFLLYLACGTVVFRLKRRNRFWLRLSVCTVFYFAFACIGWKFHSGLVIGWLNFFFLICDLLCILFIWFCFDTKINCAIFYATIGYTIEHISSRIRGLVITLIPMSFEWRLWSRLIVGVVVIAAVYFFVIRREYRRANEESYLLPKTSTLVISVISVLFIYVLSMYADSLYRKLDPILTNLSFLGLGVLLLTLQFGIFNYNRMKMDKALVSRTMELEYEQHKRSKALIDLMNVKCHDLKHQINLWRDTSDLMREKQLSELEEIVKIYETEFQTGRAALDAILSERALYCSQYHIKLSATVDGEAVACLKDEDVYSLFGNLLDNAIEYLSKVEDEGLRLITLSVTSRNKLLIIHCENYCTADLHFAEGLPVTTKADRANHGFGMKSIAYVVEQYRGAFTVKQEEDSFVVNIIIPM